MEPAEIIRKLIKEELDAGVSQRDLAWKIGVSHPTIQNILYDPDKKFKVETFRLIADYFKIQLSDLLSGTPTQILSSAESNNRLSPSLKTSLSAIYKKLSGYFEANPSDTKTLDQITQMINILTKEIEPEEKEDSKHHIVKRRKAR